MVKNQLPGSLAPYFIESGEGERYVIGTFLAAIIGRNQDTGGLMAGCILTGAKGSAMPIHHHRQSHEVILVLEGRASLELAEKRYELTPGDYVSIPPGTLHGYEFTDHHTKFLTWTFGGNANELYSSLGSPYAGTVYPEKGERPAWDRVSSDLDIVFAPSRSLASSPCPEKETVPPPDMRPYVLASGEGERLIAGDQLYIFLGDQRQSNGAFIAVLTEGPKGHPIPRHFHEKHTETFFCLSGSMSMLAGEEPAELHPGDFLHVPAKTIHSFQLTRNDTRFVGFLAPGLFEPFFRYMCDPYDGHMFPLIPQPFRFDRVMQHLAELDLKLLDRPGPPPPGNG
jgi:quercetin 2,3-dioxygenase